MERPSSDRQLLKLMPLLARLSEVSDVRPLLRGKFNLGDRIERAGERVAALQTMAIL
jgi:CTD small phosphatase-like protein 2